MMAACAPESAAGHAVQVVQHEPATKRTATEEARARLDAFMGQIASPN